MADIHVKSTLLVKDHKTYNLVRMIKKESYFINEWDNLPSQHCIGYDLFYCC